MMKKKKKQHFVQLLFVAATAATLACMSGVETGCSVITNETAIQCTSEAECLALGPDFKDTTCDKATKTCQKVAAALECETNAQCSTLKGAGTICRKSDHKCVNLRSIECPSIMNEQPEQLLNDDAIIIGAITPVGSGELGDAVERGAALAQLELTPTTTGTGLPSKTGRARPLVIVSCHEFNSNGFEGLLAAANHLVKDLQVPIVIGPIDPTDAQIVATNVTLPNKVLTILTASIVSNLDTLPSPISPIPLTWRLSYSDRDAVKVIDAFINTKLIPKLRSDGSIPANEEARIAIIAEGDYKGKQSAKVMMDGLKWNKKPDGTLSNCLENLNHPTPACIPVDFGGLNDTVGNPSPEGKISAVLGAIFTNNGSFAPPHIIVHTYATFGIQRILFPIEGAWDNTPAAGHPRPYHIGVFAPWNTFEPMFGFMDSHAGPGYVPLDQRVFALYPRTGVSDFDVENFKFALGQRFTEFEGSASPGDVLVRQTYDAVYLAAYAIAALNDKPVTGPNLAATLPRLTQGTEVIKVGTDDQLKAFGTLSRVDEGINLQGLSGSLDLSLETGAPRYSLEVSCPNLKPGGGTTNFIGSGYYYDESANAALGLFPGKCPTLINTWPPN